MLQIPNYPYQFLLTGGSGSGKRNTLLNLINHHNDIDKVYLFAKDPYDTKDQFLIFKDQSVGSKHCNDPKAFMNAQIIWMIFMKILVNTVQIKTSKY